MSPKTGPTDADVDAFIVSKGTAAVQADAGVLVDVMKAATGCDPVMWGAAIVGFGSRTYENASGLHDWFEIGFSPRSGKFACYGLTEFDGAAALLHELGPHEVSAACLYLTRLDAIDLEVLREIARGAVDSWRNVTQ
jgi:hypothetical protein